MKNELNSPWLVSDHDMNEHSDKPSGFWIYSKIGQRSTDRKVVSLLCTFTFPLDKEKRAKIEFFHQLAQKIVNDHNVSIATTSSPEIADPDLAGWVGHESDMEPPKQ